MHPRTSSHSPTTSPARTLSRRTLLGMAGVLAMAGCSDVDPLGGQDGAGDSASTVVIGSQQYYSNEIIAELYAQVIEHAGLSVTRQYQIGQREVYLPDLESGAIDLIPEYGGNLLQYYDKDAAGADAQGVLDGLARALPASLTVLDAAEATDQDSYVVTRARAQAGGLSSIADLASLGRTVTIAANSELATRPYGPEGLRTVYGVEAQVTPVEDSGGPLTVTALTDGSVDVADIYTSSPAIEDNDLVSLEDPQSLIMPQQVVPLVSAQLGAKAVQAVNGVQRRLTSADLRDLNRRSTAEELDSATIARDWLTAQGLLA